jgi:hypothetical protein
LKTPIPLIRQACRRFGAHWKSAATLVKSINPEDLLPGQTSLALPSSSTIIRLAPKNKELLKNRVPFSMFKSIDLVV